MKIMGLGDPLTFPIAVKNIQMEICSFLESEAFHFICGPFFVGPRGPTATSSFGSILGEAALTPVLPGRWQSPRAVLKVLVSQGTWDSLGRTQPYQSNHEEQSLAVPRDSNMGKGSGKAPW